MQTVLHITKLCVAMSEALSSYDFRKQASGILKLMNEWIPKKSISAIPLNGLRTFEATARHMSLKRAAEELNVTPSAVSHRLRVLEKVLGCKLLERQGTQLQLTEAGRRLAPFLTDGFEQIMTGLRNLQPG